MSATIFHRINPTDFQKFASSPVYLQRPRMIGYYEYYYEKFMIGKRIRYTRELKDLDLDYPIDLNEGLENVVVVNPKSIQPSRLHIPLNYAMSPDATIPMSKDGVQLTSVYTGRRILTQLMESFITKYDFVFHVSRYNGALYMAGPKSLNLKCDLQVHHIRLEQLLYSDSPYDFSKKEEVYDKNKSLSCLHRATLGKYDLIYAGEVQGIIAKEEFHNFDDLEALNKLRFVFSKQMYDVRNKEPKMLTYWLQAYLSNVDDIYLAYKNFEGIVEKPIEHIKVSNIPKACNSWKPQICIGLLHDILERISQLMANVNSLDSVYEFCFNAQEKIFYYNVYEGNTDKSFISQEYKNFVTKN